MAYGVERPHICTNYSLYLYIPKCNNVIHKNLQQKHAPPTSHHDDQPTSDPSSCPRSASHEEPIFLYQFLSLLYSHRKEVRGSKALLTWLDGKEDQGPSCFPPCRVSMASTRRDSEPHSRR